MVRKKNDEENVEVKEIPLHELNAMAKKGAEKRKKDAATDLLKQLNKVVS